MVVISVMNVMDKLLYAAGLANGRLADDRVKIQKLGNFRLRPMKH